MPSSERSAFSVATPRLRTLTIFVGAAAHRSDDLGTIAWSYLWVGSPEPGVTVDGGTWWTVFRRSRTEAEWSFVAPIDLRCGFTVREMWSVVTWFGTGVRFVPLGGEPWRRDLEQRPLADDTD